MFFTEQHLLRNVTLLEWMLHHKFLEAIVEKNE